LAATAAVSAVDFQIAVIVFIVIAYGFRAETARDQRTCIPRARVDLARIEQTRFNSSARHPFAAGHLKAVLVGAIACAVVVIVKAVRTVYFETRGVETTRTLPAHAIAGATVLRIGIQIKVFIHGHVAVVVDAVAHFDLSKHPLLTDDGPGTARGVSFGARTREARELTARVDAIKGFVHLAIAVLVSTITGFYFLALPSLETSTSTEKLRAAFVTRPAFNFFTARIGSNIGIDFKGTARAHQHHEHDTAEEFDRH
jgi:hypothetical protein